MSPEFELAFWLPLGIFLARATDVALGTVRMLCVTRGHRAFAVTLGFIESIVWVLAVSAVLTHLNRWINIAAFAAGHATGLAVGMWFERALALGTKVMTFVSRGDAHQVATRLRDGGRIVTTLDGNGQNGPVSICVAIVPRKEVSSFVEIAREADPRVIVTVEAATQRNIMNSGSPERATSAQDLAVA